MAPRTARIITLDKQELPREWRRFLAYLCFMLFYVEFVLGGTKLWTAHVGSRDGFLERYWGSLSQLILAGTMYLCGQCLWHGRRSTARWLGIGATAIVFVAGLKLFFLFGRPGITLYWLTQPSHAGEIFSPRSSVAGPRRAISTHNGV